MPDYEVDTTGCVKAQSEWMQGYLAVPLRFTPFSLEGERAAAGASSVAGGLTQCTHITTDGVGDSETGSVVRRAVDPEAGREPPDRLAECVAALAELPQCVQR